MIKQTDGNSEVHGIFASVMQAHPDPQSLYHYNKGMMAFHYSQKGDVVMRFDETRGSVEALAAELDQTYGIGADRAQAIASRYVECRDDMGNGAGYTVLATAPLTPDEIRTVDAGVIRLFIGITCLYTDLRHGPGIVAEVMDEIRSGAPSDPTSVENRIKIVGETSIVCD